MELPNEIIFHIFKSLNKSDLKSARLVSTAWAALAAEYLFDQAYVSPHPENLEVFNAITQHPLLSKCVKTLRYDAVDFVDSYTEERYFQDLWRQTYNEGDTFYFQCLKGLISDPDIHNWMSLANDAPKGFNVLRGCEYYRFIRRKCKGYRFIDRGYQEFRRCAALQRAQFNSGNFLEIFVEGLQKLENLSCVILDDRWPSHRGGLYMMPIELATKRATGSPMSRNWNLFHAYPRKWEWVPRRYGLDSVSGATDGAEHFWAITGALIRSRRNIQTFELGDENYQGLPPYVFNRNQPTNLNFFGLDILAFSGLKRLKLGISTYGDEKTPEFFPNMDGLRFLLGSMHHLEILELNLPADLEDKPTFYTYNQIFPREGQWSHLTSLSLHNFASSAEDFLSLLIRQTPILDDLQLGTVELFTGSWEGVIECMMKSLHLSSSAIDPYCTFWHCGDTDFFLRKDVFAIYEIGEYVVYGGRHPCLRIDQPDSAAQNYVTDNLREFYGVPSST